MSEIPKAAAIEQFRKGDLLQRVIDDVQSEAANAAEMKAAASGNPLMLMQVQLAADLRKLKRCTPSISVAGIACVTA